VIAPTAMDADALSTAAFVMEPSQGTRYVNTLPGRACLVLDRAGGRHLSRGWPSAVL
jgi:thiamine biosynthesis lipoprotein